MQSGSLRCCEECSCCVRKKKCAAEISLLKWMIQHVFSAAGELKLISPASVAVAAIRLQRGHVITENYSALIFTSGSPPPPFL